MAATGVVAGYQGKQVLRGVDIEVISNELVAVIGHNGAGKTTLLKALFGLVEISKGRVVLDGAVWRPSPAALLKAGVAFVPQGNQVFTRLTVMENLRIAWTSIDSGYNFNDRVSGVMELFPFLRDRRNQVAGALSGGERQMLALSRALMFEPRVLLLDEPSLGLAPPMVSKVLATIRSLAQDRSMGVLVVEQKVREVLRVADRVYVIRRGEVAYQGKADRLLADDELLRKTYL